MARVTNPLSDAQIKRSKPAEKEYKLFDGGGLFLVVKPNGSKLWRIKYRFDNKEKTKSLGKYPIISLSSAREKLQELKEQLANGNDPANIATTKSKRKYTFEDVSKKFLDFKMHELSLVYFKKQKRRLELYINPKIGGIYINDIKKSDIIDLIKNVSNVKTVSSKQHSNKAETSRIVFNLLEQVFKFAFHNDYTHNAVMQGIDKSAIIPKKEIVHYKAATDEKEIRNIFYMITNYLGDAATKNALMFLALTALRSGNVRGLKWDMIDEKKAIIVFPAEAMKTKREFRIPITNNIQMIIDDMRSITGDREYVFCSMLCKTKPLSENTLGYALKRMDIINHTPHGFRSSFSTMAYEHQKEHGFSSEVIESQLAHETGNAVKSAYLRSDFIEDRRDLMEWWSDFLTQDS